MNTSYIGLPSSHQDKTILVKISGREIAHPDFPHLIAALKHEIARKVRFLLVFGGGDQISQYYTERTGQVRPSGGVTPPEVLEQGVLPAYVSQRAFLAESFASESPNIIPPDKLVCHYRDEVMGLVGDPDTVEGVDLEQSLNIVGFVGQVGDQMVNVNADWIVHTLLQQYHDRIEEVLLFTPTGGILDKQGHKRSLLTQAVLEQIVAGDHASIEVDGGMKTKVIALVEIFRQKLAQKIALLSITDVEAELEQVLGAGSLCVDHLEDTVLEPLTQEESTVFDQVYDTFVHAGKWRAQSDEQLQRAKACHLLSKSPSKNLLLGGVSLQPGGCLGTFVTNVWTQENFQRNGLGLRLMEQVKTQAASFYLYSSNPALWKFYRACGMTDHGTEWKHLSADQQRLAEQTPHSEGAHLFTFETL